MNTNTYVDNVFLSAYTEDEARSKWVKAKNLFFTCNKNLREFISNKNKILNYFLESDKLDGKNHKILGISWNSDKDIISFP